jgi:large subunit ribosomal protein L4
VTAHTVEVRTVAGEVSGAVLLDQAVFGIQPNVPVLHQVVTAQLAAARRGTHSTRTRAEVRGGGKKPFKQKGTGRARQGSIRAPHWAGGGVALGPKPRTYRQRTPRKMIQLALHSALSDRADAQRVVVVDHWPWTEARTRVAKELLGILGLDGSVLVVLDRSRDEQAFLSFRNLAEAQVILSGELNAYDVLCNDWLLFTRATLPGVTTEGPAPADREPAVPTPVEEAPVAGDPAGVTGDAGEDEPGGESGKDEPGDDDAETEARADAGLGDTVAASTGEEAPAAERDETPAAGRDEATVDGPAADEKGTEKA